MPICQLFQEVLSVLFVWGSCWTFRCCLHTQAKWFLIPDSRHSFPYTRHCRRRCSSPQLPHVQGCCCVLVYLFVCLFGFCGGLADCLNPALSFTLRFIVYRTAQIHPVPLHSFVHSLWDGSCWKCPKLWDWQLSERALFCLLVTPYLLWPSGRM